MKHVDITTKAFIFLLINTKYIFQKKCLLKTATNDQLVIIREIFLNILNENLQISKDKKKRISKYKSILAKAIQSNTNIKKLIKYKINIILRIFKILKKNINELL